MALLATKQSSLDALDPLVAPLTKRQPTAPTTLTAMPAIAPLMPTPTAQPLAPPPPDSFGAQPLTEAPLPPPTSVPTTPGATALPPPAPDNFGAPAPGAEPITTFGPGDNLIPTQINPVTDPRTAATQGLVDTAAGKVGGVDLRAAGSDIFNSLLAQSLPGYQAAARGILQDAAAGGRLGSGMTEEELTSDPFGASGLGLQLGKYRTQLAQQLAGSLAPAEAEGRRADLSSLAGLEGQQFGQGAEQRGELRGERGYQSDQSQQALQDRINQLILQDQLLNSATGRAATAAGVNLAGAGIEGQQAATDQAGAGGLLGQQSEDDYLQQQMAAQQAGGSPSGTPAPPGYKWVGDKLVKITDQTT
jgi:hypothetical protein